MVPLNQHEQILEGNQGILAGVASLAENIERAVSPFRRSFSQPSDLRSNPRRQFQLDGVGLRIALPGMMT